MKDIPQSDAPEVSGGYSPEEQGFPVFPIPIEYPRNPVWPFPESPPLPGDPQPILPEN